MSTVHKMGTKIKCEQCSVEVYSMRNLKQHVRSVHMKMVAARSNKGQKEMEDKEVQPLLQEQPNEDEGQAQEKENSQEIED